MSSTNVDVLKCMCRLCAKQDKHCVNVFSNDGNKHFIQKKIRLCLPITIKENDVMPQQICLSCLNKLDTCYELYSGCVSAQSTIKKLIESSEDDSVTAIPYPNPLIKVRKAVGSDSSNTSASSTISLQDYLKQDYNQPADLYPQTKVRQTVSNSTPHKSTNEANNETNTKSRRLSDSGYPRIKVRKLDTDMTDTEMTPVDSSRDQRKSTGSELVNNNLNTATILQTVEDNEVSACTPVQTMSIPNIEKAIPSDSSSAQLHLLPKITNLQSLAKPSESSTTPTTIMTSDSGGYQISTQSINGIQPPQNVYLTSIPDSITNPCTQMMASPIPSTYVASQTLVPSPLITSYITSPTANGNQITQSITSNYLIQQQPIDPGTTTSNAVVYMNTLNPATNILPQNTSQHINFAVSSAASNNNNILFTQELQKQPSSTQNSEVYTHFNKFALNTTADKTLTTATSSIFVSQTPVISNVQSLPLKTYERVQQVTQIHRPQTDSVSQNSTATSSALPMNNASLTQEKTLNAGTQNMSNEILQNLLLTSSKPETYNQNIKNGNVGNKRTSRSNCGLISELNSQVSICVPNRTLLNKNCSANNDSNNKKLGSRMATTINPPGVPHRTSLKNDCSANNNSNNKIIRLASTINPPGMPHRTSLKNDCSANNNSNNKLGARMAITINPAGVSPSSSNNPGLPPPVYLVQKSTVASRKSANNIQPHTNSSSRASLDASSLSAATNSQAMNGPSSGQQAAVAARVYTNISRPTPHSAASSTIPKSTVSYANIRKTSLCSSSSLLPTSAVSVNGTATASPTTVVNSVSAGAHDSVGEVKEQNEICSIRTLKEESDSMIVLVSSSTNSPGASSENKPLKSETVCPYCHKDFPPDILIHHKVLHFRERFFTCIDCGKNFKTEIGLQKHRCEV